MRRFFLIAALTANTACLLGQSDTSGVYSYTEKMPEFPGGNNAMAAFMRQNVIYPDSERINNIQGRVVVKFTVDTDGSIKNPRVIKSVSAGLDSETLRVTRLLPRFTPGYIYGKPAKAYYALPFLFRLEESETGPDGLPVYRVVQEQPIYPGGKEAMDIFIASNIRYPESSLRDRIEGKVQVRLVVDTDGSVKYPEIRKGIVPPLDSEAIRVVKLLRGFKPGREDGKAVRVYFNVPVTFKLPDDSIGRPQSAAYTFSETQPVFPGGDAALMRFLQQHINYPDFEAKAGIQGKVLLRFVVMEDGSVSDVMVMRSVSPGLDKEAVRVVKLLPKFRPGTRGGEAVKVYFNLPIVFKLVGGTTNVQFDMNQLALKEEKDGDFVKGVTLMNQHKYKAAMEFFEKSIFNYPQDYFGYELKGYCESDIARERAACKDFKKAKELGSPTANLYLARYCF